MRAVRHKEDSEKIAILGQQTEAWKPDTKHLTQRNFDDRAKIAWATGHFTILLW